MRTVERIRVQKLSYGAEVLTEIRMKVKELQRSTKRDAFLITINGKGERTMEGWWREGTLAFQNI